MDQNRLPLCEALDQYTRETSVRFHMPGHKGIAPELPFPLAWDVTEVPGTGDLYTGEGPIFQAEALAAEAFGAAHSFFSTGGASLAIFAMLAVTAGQGDKVIVARNAHRSVLDAMALLGVEPVWMKIESDKATGLPGAAAVGEAERMIRDHPDARGMLITYPDYYGHCADIGSLARAAHGAGMRLLVDQAHGSHLHFHEDLPLSAGDAGADLWADSAHKTLPALTQGAYLHTVKGIDPARVRAALALGGSSSPSYLIMASLDLARRIAVTQGHAKLELLLEALQEFRREAEKIPGLYCPEISGHAGVFCQDPTRIVISPCGLGMTGYQADRWLREHCRIQSEMADEGHVVFIVTMSDGRDRLCTLLSGLKQMAEAHMGGKPLRLSAPVSLPIAPQKMSLREALFSPREWIPLEGARDRIAAASFGLYPPGIPAVCPGETITQEILEGLLAGKMRGGRLFGAEDEKIAVVK